MKHARGLGQAGPTAVLLAVAVAMAMAMAIGLVLRQIAEQSGCPLPLVLYREEPLSSVMTALPWTMRYYRVLDAQDRLLCIAVDIGRDGRRMKRLVSGNEDLARLSGEAEDWIRRHAAVPH